MSPTSPPPLEFADRRLLVVEDIDDSRVMMQQMLKHAIGCEVDAAADGQQALDMLTARLYDLAVLDLRIPRMDGMKLLEQVKRKQLPTVCIILTGVGGVADAVQAMQLGAYDFLTKPGDPELLCLLIQKALRQARQPAPVESPPPVGRRAVYAAFAHDAWGRWTDRLIRRKRIGNIKQLKALVATSYLELPPDDRAAVDAILAEMIHASVMNDSHRGRV